MLNVPEGVYGLEQCHKSIEEKISNKLTVMYGNKHRCHNYAMLQTTLHFYHRSHIPLNTGSKGCRQFALKICYKSSLSAV